MKAPCGVNLHHAVTVSQQRLGKRVAQLSSARMNEVCAALTLLSGSRCKLVTGEISRPSPNLSKPKSGVSEPLAGNLNINIVENTTFARDTAFLGTCVAARVIVRFRPSLVSLPFSDILVCPFYPTAN